MSAFRSLIVACITIVLVQRAGAQGLSFDPGLAARRGGAAVTARAAINAAPLVAGGAGTLAVEVTIDPRYHIQSAYPDKDYIATALTPKAVAGITFGHVKYPVAVNVPAPAALPGTPPIPVYEGTVYLLLPFTVDAAATPGQRTIDLTLTAQACDATSCLPPKDLALSVPVTISPARPAIVRTVCA